MRPVLAVQHVRSFNSSAALRCVFLLPACPLRCQTRTSAPRLPSTAIPRRSKSSQSSADLQALLDAEAAQERERRLPRALRWARPDRDEGINTRQVVLIDATTNELSPRPQPLAQVLAGMDRRREFLVRVGSPNEEVPLCKILPKDEVFAKEQAKAKARTEVAKNKRKREGKTLEIGWTTAEGDLVHRFRKARQFIDDGERVTFLIENRQKRSTVPPDKIADMLEKVRGAMSLMPKVVEIGREGKPGGKLKLIYGYPDGPKT